MEVMRVNDTFATKNEVLKKFGFTGRILVQAIWRIPGTNRDVWVATDGKYDGGENTLKNLGNNFMDRRDPNTSGADTYGVHADEDVERLLFLRTEVYRKPVIKFAGVFKPDLPASVWNVSAWKRVSDECSLPDGSWAIPEVSV